MEILAFTDKSLKIMYQFTRNHAIALALLARSWISDNVHSLLNISITYFFLKVKMCFNVLQNLRVQGSQCIVLYKLNYILEVTQPVALGTRSNWMRGKSDLP